MKYKIFARTWWKKNKLWPDGLEPHFGKKRTIKYVDTRQEAQRICCDYNDSYDVKYNNKLGLKWEFES